MEKGKSRASSSTREVPKIERRVIEKNRRNRMKILYSRLFSLLPDHRSKAALSLQDKVGEVAGYIESLKTKLERMKERRESLKPRKRSNNSCITTEIQANEKSLPPPLVEVHDMGPNMDVILLSGLEKLSKFYSIIHLLHEDGIEVVTANFSVHGSSSIQIIYDKVQKARTGVGATTILSRTVKDFISGSTSSTEVESNLGLWGCGIQSDIWDFEIPEVINDYDYRSLGYCHHQLFY